MISFLFGKYPFNVTASSPGELCLSHCSSLITQPSCTDCPDAELGELKACVHTDGVA